MSEAALVVIFNHRYEQNLPRLRAYYGARYPRLSFVVPFARTQDADVLRVWESSYRFQSYIAQAWSALEHTAADHFAFVGDDCILNPALDAFNLAAELGLDEDTGYNVEMISLNEQRYRWPFFKQVLNQAQASETYFAWRNELPDAAEMRRRIERHGFKTGELRFAERGREARRFSLLRDLRKFRRFKAQGLTRPKLPLVTGWSDFVVVPRRHMPEFAALCHVFTAMGLFVEAAIPTALALACPKLKTEGDSAWKATMAWRPEERATLIEPMQNSMRRLCTAFGPKELLKHPVKLSSFANDLP